MTFEPIGSQGVTKPSQPKAMRRPLGPTVDGGETAVSEGVGSETWDSIAREAAASALQLVAEAPWRPDAMALKQARRQLWRDAAHGLERISLERLPRGGEPTLGATSISVGQVLGLIIEGYSVERITAEYQGSIDERDVREALIFALRLAS